MNKLFAGALVAASVFVACAREPSGPATASASTAASASASGARAMVAAGARLVDVRSPEEFADGHIEGAVNIPVQELGQRLAELEDAKEKGVVVYCRSGKRSARAAEILAGAGHRSVYDLGGMSSW